MSRLSRENTDVLLLVQAMLGAVSPNFRRVSVGHVMDTVQLQFVLEHESPEDREEISDIVFEFEAQQDGQVDVSVEIIVNKASLVEIPAAGRIVFTRREPGIR